MINNKSCKKATVARGPASDMHPADIKCALEKAGWSLRQLAKKHDLSSSALGNTLRRRYPRVERIIATTLGMEPWEIWPSRYDQNHNPIKKHRGWPQAKSFKPKNSTETPEVRQGDEQ